MSDRGTARWLLAAAMGFMFAFVAAVATGGPR